MSFTQGFLFSYRARVSEQNLDDFRAQSWFIPELIRDLVGYDIENESVFSSVVERLHGIQIRQHLHLPAAGGAAAARFRPSVHAHASCCSRPTKAARSAKAFRFSHMPVIDTEHSLRNLPELQGATAS